jgi:diaminopimelate decarboxylase
MMLVQSPNVSVQPSTTTINEDEHLVIGGIDTVELAEKFGTPLWIMDEQTILDSIKAFKEGLAGYPNHQILYAGKAFLI